MRFPRTLPRVRTRHGLAAVALFAQLVAATGAPVVTSRSNAQGESPYPCQNRPCGCVTSELCWAGDCCCFTLEQKLAWADANGVAPPDHVRPLVESRKAQKPKPSCCASCCEPADAPSPAPAATGTSEIRLVAGVYAQKCRGEGPAGLLKLDLVLTPDAPLAPRGPVPVFAGRVASDPPTFSSSLSPPTPPPRPA
jgi:hypothetical protein